MKIHRVWFALLGFALIFLANGIPGTQMWLVVPSAMLMFVCLWHVFTDTDYVTIWRTKQ